MQYAFMKTLEQLLKQDERFVSNEKELLKNKVVQEALKFDEKLIELLLSQEEVKEKFFCQVAKTLVFNQNEFVRFVSNKTFLPDSYTAFKNKIGLVNNKDELISQTNDVVLNFPYKDCLLEGGQTKEDKKRKEVFFNRTLAHDEITCLLEPKVLGNFKRYTKDGEQEVKKLKRDDKGDLKENFIFKGNNLLVLHSLKQQFAGKVKLIYIDPPYNTGNDSFGYNDNFNHSTWLTFMKNRLEVARELLREDGVIFVQCDDNEQAYLKVLMDEIFGRENLNSIISIKVSSESGVKVNANKPVRIKEYLLTYAKTAKYIYKKGFVKNKNFDPNYSYYVKNRNQKPSTWEIQNIKKAFEKIEKKEAGFESLYNFQVKNKDKIFSVRDISVKLKEQFGDNPNQFFVIKKENKSTILWKKGEVVFFENKVNFVDGEECATKYLSDIWNDISWDGIAKEGTIKLKSGKKPERLIKRIIEISTQPNDLVLDFHLGSGTTCAVAHKMGRQYIGVEQMDYVQDIAVERMKKVIEGEQGGISKVVKWQGGGEFIYAELMEVNQIYIKQIEEAESLEQLQAVYEVVQEKAFLSYRVKKFEGRVIDDEEFKFLSLEEQKQILIEILDENMLYLAKNEMGDKDFGIDEKVLELNKQFYQEKQESLVFEVEQEAGDE